MDGPMPAEDRSPTPPVGGPGQDQAPGTQEGSPPPAQDGDAEFSEVVM